MLVNQVQYFPGHESRFKTGNLIIQYFITFSGNCLGESTLIETKLYQLKYEANHSRINQVKLSEDFEQPEVILGPFLNILSHV